MASAKALAIANASTSSGAKSISRVSNVTTSPSFVSAADLALDVLALDVLGAGLSVLGFFVISFLGLGLSAGGFSIKAFALCKIKGAVCVPTPGTAANSSTGIAANCSTLLIPFSAKRLTKVGPTYLTSVNSSAIATTPFLIIITF